VPPQRKNATYTKYVRALRDYLEGFLRRTQPLLDVGEVVGPAAEEKFEGLWKEGKVAGWPLEATGLQPQGGDGDGGVGAPRYVCVHVCVCVYLGLWARVCDGGCGLMPRA
jgi:splicing factor 3A subunit 3